MGALGSGLLQGFIQAQQVKKQREMEEADLKLRQQKFKLESDQIEHQKKIMEDYVYPALGQLAGKMVPQTQGQQPQQSPPVGPVQQATPTVNPFGSIATPTAQQSQPTSSQPQTGQVDGQKYISARMAALLETAGVKIPSQLIEPNPTYKLMRTPSGDIQNMPIYPNQIIPKGTEPESEAAVAERAVPSLEKDLAKKADELIQQGKLKPEDAFDWKQGQRAKIAQARGQAYVSSRPFPTLDTQNENRPTYATAGEMAANPGRYIPASEGDKVLNKTALIEDIRGALINTRASLMKLQADFSMGMRTKIALALRDRDPQSAISSLINSEAGKELTPDQQDYLINITQLQEQALAMRSVLGAGQGSETLREAVLRTIPSGTTPSKEYGLKQLTQFEGTLDRLSRGVPKLKLRDMPKSKEKKAPKDMTDDEIRQELSK